MLLLGIWLTPFIRINIVQKSYPVYCTILIYLVVTHHGRDYQNWNVVDVMHHRGLCWKHNWSRLLVCSKFGGKKWLFALLAVNFAFPAHYNRTPDYWLRGPILKLAFWALPSTWILGKFIRSNIGPTFLSNFRTHCVSDLSAQRGSHWRAISSPATLPNDIWYFGATDRRKMGVFDQHEELSTKLGQIRPHRVSDIVSSTGSSSAQNIGPSLPNGEFRQHYYRTFD